MKLTRYKLGEILELQRGYDLPSSQMKKGDILVAGSNGVGKSSVSCPLKPSDSAPLKHSTMPP